MSKASKILEFLTLLAGPILTAIGTLTLVLGIQNEIWGPYMSISFMGIGLVVLFLSLTWWGKVSDPLTFVLKTANKTLSLYAIELMCLAGVAFVEPVIARVILNAMKTSGNEAAIERFSEMTELLSDIMFRSMTCFCIAVGIAAVGWLLGLATRKPKKA